VSASELRIGLVGAGGISRVHADAWRALGAHVTVTSRTGAEELAAEYGMSVAPDVETLLAEVDAVDIATPSSTHVGIALAAIAAGVHVICEKPLAPTAVEARRIVDAATAAGVRLFPAHVVRYFPAYSRIKAQIDAGTIGEVSTQRLFRRGSAPSAPWFFLESTGGGVIRDLMIHDIDQAAWLAGPVVSVSAMQDPPTIDDIVPVPVTARVELVHASGALSHLEATWGAPGLAFRTGIEIVGSLGRLAYDSAEDSSLQREATADHLPPAFPTDSPYLSQLADFVAAIQQDADARVSGPDGVAAIAVAEAAYASIAAGGPIPLTPAAG
jgi:myo-inositol 2-dehydrogenase/D-chiro-inositol 1-dehydrogenase